MPDLLEFEEPIGVLLKEIEALSLMPRTAEREKSIETLRRRAEQIRAELYANLTPWQRVLVARHPNRPNTLDYVERLFTAWDELHGDRRFADDHAIVCGFADYRGRPVAIVGHQKGGDTKQKIYRNFGYARPEGYRKALRVMELAEKFGRPIVVFVDTPAAYPGVESEERGVLIKIPGKVEIKPNGQIVSTFDDNPQAPFSSLKLHFNSGARAPLMLPQKCGNYRILSELTPWSAVDPDNPTSAETVTHASSFQVDSGPGGSACPYGSLRPTLRSGLADPIAGASSAFSVSLSRPDGSQRFTGLDLTLPPGLVANLSGIPACADSVLGAIPSAEGTGAAELAHPSCPEASRIGSVSVGVGAGSPFYVNTGRAYLAGPYKGAPLSIAVVAPAVSGPFDLGNVVVRNPVYLDPRTAQVTIKSDPVPTSLHGIVLDLSDIRVTVDRDRFIQAPTSCEEMSVRARVSGEEGGDVSLQNRFQVGECGALDFRPRLKLQLHGGTERGAYQRLLATVAAKPGEANIARAAVTLPHSAFLAQEHIRTICTRVQFAANSCPRASIYGHARAITPLLDEPLTGPVYLRSSDNQLPDVVAVLKGPDAMPIEVELSGRVDSVHGGLRNTFDVVPDAPVSKFTLSMLGGKKSLIVNSRNLCNGPTQRATVRLRAHNGLAHDFRPVVGNDCGKGKTGKQGGRPKRPAP